MTSVPYIMPRQTLVQRFTRALGRLLSHVGVDAEQYHTLLQASLTMDFRSSGPFSRGGASQTKNALKMAVALNLLFSSILAIIISMTAPSFYYSLITLGYCMTMLGMLILMEFALVVISPDDFPILAHRPISSRTFMAVRFSNLLFYVLVLGLSLNLGPAILGIFCDDSLWYFPLVYLGVSVVANLFVAAAVVAIYGLLMRWLNYERLKDVLAYCQIVFSFIFFLGYQLIPRLFLRSSGSHVEIVSHTWGYLFPPTWFADMIEIGQHHWSLPTFISAGFGLVVMLLILPGIFRAISLDYSERLGRMITASSKTVSSAPVRAPRRGARGCCHFMFAIPRNWHSFRLFVRCSAGTANSRCNCSRSSGRCSRCCWWWDSTAIIGRKSRGCPLALRPWRLRCCTAALVALIPYSDEYAGSWIFQIAPLQKQDLILRAVKKAAAIYIFVPMLVLYVLVFQFFMPPVETLKLGIYGFLSGWLLFEIALFRFRDFPFSRKAEKAVPARQYALFMFIFPLMVVAFLIPMTIARSPVTIITFLALMAALNLLLGRFNNRRFAMRNLYVE